MFYVLKIMNFVKYKNLYLFYNFSRILKNLTIFYKIYLTICQYASNISEF
jgi:hypothetical protein